MKRVKLFSTILALALCASIGTGCFDGTQSSSNDSSSGSDTPSAEPIVTWEENYASPDYATVDYTDYTTWYFDSENGDNGNVGTNENEPLRSLNILNRKIRTATADNPVRIRIKAGSVYNGELLATDFIATEEKPLVIDTYGVTEETPWATFNGTVDQGATVSVGASNIRIFGLEITGEECWRGIYVYSTEAGALENIVISGNYVHDVNFRWQWEDKTCEEMNPDVNEFQKKQMDITPSNEYDHTMGAIIVNTSTSLTTGASWTENVWIENNRMERCARVALWITNAWAGQPGITYMGNNRYCDDDNGIYWSKNVYVRNNFCNYIGGDGMVMVGVRGGVMEGNICYNAAFLTGRSSNCGIWIQACREILMQYNEAAYTWRRGSSGDEQGFDIDIACYDIVFQYNYAHHNDGGAILLCNEEDMRNLYDENGEFIMTENGAPKVELLPGKWGEVYVRNNVFVDNGRKTTNCASFQFAAGGMDGCYIENNTVIINGDKTTQLLCTGNLVGRTIENVNFYFRNNVFAVRNTTNKVYQPYSDALTRPVFDNNVFWNFSEDFLNELSGAEGVLVVDPQIDLEAEASDGIENALKFVTKNSELFTQGKKFTTKMSVTDFAGNVVDSRLYIGAFCR